MPLRKITIQKEGAETIVDAYIDYLGQTITSGEFSLEQKLKIK